MRTAHFLLLSALAAGCGPTLAPIEAGSHAAERATQDQQLILRAAHELDFDELDIEVGLDRRAAQGIVDQRPFSTFAELDAVPYVGDSALDDLLHYAVARWGDETWVHGIAEGSEEAEAILDIVNQVGVEELEALGLSPYVAMGIAEFRPFVDLTELSSVCALAASDFDTLLAHVEHTASCPEGQVTSSDGPTYDSLDRAVQQASASATLTLCPGDYTLEGGAERDLTIVGAGMGLTRIDLVDPMHEYIEFEGLVTLVDLTATLHGGQLSAHSLSLVGAKLQGSGHVNCWSGDGALFDDAIVEDVYVSLYNHCDGHIIDSVFRRADLIVQGVEATITGSSFSEAVTAIHITSPFTTGFVTMSDSAVHNNLIGINVGDGKLTVENSDFGIGATDNVDADIKAGSSKETSLHAGESLECDSDGFWGRCE